MQVKILDKAQSNVAAEIHDLKLPFASAHQVAQRVAGGYVDKKKVENLMQAAKRLKDQRDLDEALSAIGDQNHELEAAAAFLACAIVRAS